MQADAGAELRLQHTSPTNASCAHLPIALKAYYSDYMVLFRHACFFGCLVVSLAGSVSAQPKVLPDAGSTGSEFGTVVSIDGDTAAVGSPFDGDGGADAGAVYVFVNNAGTWSLQAKLVASDAAAGDEFGTTVGLGGDTIVIGAPHDDDDGGSSGSAYVYTRSGTDWTLQQKLTANDAESGDKFGHGVSLDGDTVAICASNGNNDDGSVYVYTRTAGAWLLQQEFSATGVVPGDDFAERVSLDGDSLVVSADDDNGGVGAAYVFVRSGSTWNQQQKLTGSGTVVDDDFGTSLAIDGDTIVVGAERHDPDGAVFVFTRSGTTWTEQQKLTPSDTSNASTFGSSVGLQGNLLVVGDRRNDEQADNGGAAHFFTRSGTTWSEQQKLVASDGGADDNLGVSAALSGTSAILGANLDDDQGSDSGSAYVFMYTGVCGDGILASGEACDDGNTANGDGCNSMCLIENGSPCTVDNECASGVCDTVGSNTCEPANACGNGVIEGSEACDDGNTSNGDGCSSSCLRENGQPCTNDNQCQSTVCDTVGSNTCEPANACGNGKVDSGEACDDGGTANGDGCSSTCLLENGEPCTNDNQCASDTCDTLGSNTCEPANSCGNGAVESGEYCDDGNTSNGDGCSSNCLRENGQPCTNDNQCASTVCDTVGSSTCEPANACGNGAVEAGEACDDGGTANGDGCSSSCLLENGEPCTNDNQCTSTVCDTAGSNTCEPANACGNGTVEAGEACDDGNTATGDGCDNSCLLEIGEPCSNGPQCASGVCNTGAMPPVCAPPSGCGNGSLDAGEACDDGNNNNGDGCNASCLLEDLEPCTDNSQCASNACDTLGSNTCEPADMCGNGTVETGEACDDGGTANGDGCNSTCELENGEPCNNNNQCASNACDTLGSNTCEPANSCGNGTEEAGEYCDDGNTANGDGCNASCELEDGQPCADGTQCASGVCDTVGSNTCEPANTCGNGVLEAGEACDDGGTADGDGCDSSCLLDVGEPCSDNTQCTTAVCNMAEMPPVCAPPTGCGNGTLDPGEGCDDGNNSQGDGCDAACRIEDDGPCTDNGQCASGACDTVGSNTCEPANMCGNGTLDAGEGCDDGNTDPDDGCSATCFLEDDQPCTLSSECATNYCDTSQNPAVCTTPVTVCGNGALEALEACDDGNTIDDDGCSATCLLEGNQPCTDGVQCVSGVCDTSVSPATCEPVVTIKNIPVGTWHGGGCTVGATRSVPSWPLVLLVLGAVARRTSRRRAR